MEICEIQKSFTVPGADTPPLLVLLSPERRDLNSISEKLHHPTSGEDHKEWRVTLIIDINAGILFSSLINTHSI